MASGAMRTRRRPGRVVPPPRPLRRLSDPTARARAWAAPAPRGPSRGLCLFPARPPGGAGGPNWRPPRLAVPAPERTAAVLTGVLGMRHVRDFARPEGAVHVFAMGAGGASAEIQLLQDTSAPARQGAGAVHHVAFRIPDADYAAWAERLTQTRVPSSGPVDRFYFRSLYFREPNGILFEIATDGPGFTADEPLETLGEGLALPPFLEPRRAEIEAGLKPL